MPPERREGSPRRERRSSTFSLSAAFRSPRKRTSVLETPITDAIKQGPPDSPTLPRVSQPDPRDIPTCVERMHYPVYDPLNPRHNPAVRSDPSRQVRDDHTSNSHDAHTPKTQKQHRLLEELPKRSIHKARSGLLAIKTGLQRLSFRESAEVTEGVPHPNERCEERRQERREAVRRRGPGHSSTTQEDLSFGNSLYRASLGRRPPPNTDGAADDFNFTPRAVSPPLLTNVVSAPAQLGSTSSSQSIDQPDMTEEQPATVVRDEPPPYCSRMSRDSQNTSTDGALDRAASSKTQDRSTRSGTSTEWEGLGSPASSFRYENMTLHVQAHKPATVSPVTSARSSTSAPSNSRSEALVSQERLPLREDLQEFLDDEEEPQFAAPSPPSAVVPVAFPGVYHALLDQWTTDPRNKTDKIPSTTRESATYNTVRIPQVFQARDELSPTQSEDHHSFELHMSIRNEDQETSAEPYSEFQHSRLDLTAPWETISPTDRRYSLSIGGWDRTIESLYDGSDYSPCHYTSGSSPSANVTSRTSVYDDIWSPLESPINEDVLFSSFFRNDFRNEYYMADGKTTTDHRPDGGDMGVKAERRVFGDGTMHSGRGLDRTPSDRLREITERVSSRSLQRPSQLNPRPEQRKSESTDDDTFLRHPHQG
ncbi:hypothetical protein N7532_000417 [Penicillium argentinense]|uniref:Uncharacterized protein n=1 Tax=Penicillium argentinense TaxID=1131581 RepID=A0A9W9G6Q2_9EURO|nr:uncharacterized protein N7532_000417 [Penicillium argentinense]KAJ5112372.1 hypothetical protein N7532_000417 [Penicillium argentinense]